MIRYTVYETGWVWGMMDRMIEGMNRGMMSSMMNLVDDMMIGCMMVCMMIHMRGVPQGHNRRPGGGQVLLQKHAPAKNVAQVRMVKGWLGLCLTPRPLVIM